MCIIWMWVDSTMKYECVFCKLQAKNGKNNDDTNKDDYDDDDDNDGKKAATTKEMEYRRKR